MAIAPDRLPAHPLVVAATASAVNANGLEASKLALDKSNVDDALIDALRAAAEAELKAAKKDESTNARAAKQSGATADLAAAEAAKAVVKQAQAKADAVKAPYATPKGLEPDYDAVDHFSASERRPYGLVSGYLGGCRHESSRPPVQVLFVDSSLSRWLLIPIKDIAVFSRVEDHSAAFGLRDVLWLKPDTRVVEGDEADAVDQSYLNGPFIRVDEVAMTVSGGTFPRQGGLLLEAITPGCCGKTRR